MVIFLVGILKIPYIFISYTDDYTPPSKYKIKINTITRIMEVNEQKSCSALYCANLDSTKVRVKLTKKEFNALKQLLKEEKINNEFINIIQLILNDYLLVDINDSSWEKFKNMDYNSDGMVTSREYGNYMLNDIK